MALKREDTPYAVTMVLRKKTKQRQEKTTKLRLDCSPTNILSRVIHKSENKDMQTKVKEDAVNKRLGREASSTKVEDKYHHDHGPK